MPTALRLCLCACVCMPAFVFVNALWDFRIWRAHSSSETFQLQPINKTWRAVEAGLRWSSFWLILKGACLLLCMYICCPLMLVMCMCVGMCRAVCVSTVFLQRCMRLVLMCLSCNWVAGNSIGKVWDNHCVISVHYRTAVALAHQHWRQEFVEFACKCSTLVQPLIQLICMHVQSRIHNSRSC